MKNNKKAAALLIAALMASAVTMNGCSESTESYSEPTTAASTESTTEETTEPEEVSIKKIKRTHDECRMGAEVTELKSVEGHVGDGEAIGYVTPIGDGVVVLTCFDYNGETGTSAKLLSVDVVEDKILGEITTSAALEPYGWTSKGFIVKYFDEDKFCFYDESLEKIDEFDFRYLNGAFSEDGESYYFVMDNSLYRTDLGVGNYEKISTDDKVKLFGYVNDKIIRNGMVSAEVSFHDLYTDFYMSALFDLESGRAVMMNRDVSDVTVAKNGVFMRSSYASDDENFYFANRSGECFIYESPNHIFASMMPETGHIYFNDGTLHIGKFADSGALSWLRYDLGSNEIYSAAGLDEENLFVVSERKDDELKYVVIDPEYREYVDEAPCDKVDDVFVCDEEDYKLVSAFTKDIPEAASYLSEERKRADEIEKKYGVKIYISNQCEAFLNDDGYDLDKHCMLTGEEYNVPDEKQFINATLDGLESSMQKYPEGFFRQFRNLVGTQGIEIHLVGTISDELFGAAAYAHSEGDAYFITMDIAQDNEVNFPHELWHNTESYINDRKPELLSDENWADYNPEGFKYVGYEDYGDASISYDFTYEVSDENADWYFYDTYSKTNTLEDKARIMEHAMTDTEYDKNFFESPHVKAKLKRMCEAIRETFDTTGWNDLPWEAYL